MRSTKLLHNYGQYLDTSALTLSEHLVSGLVTLSISDFESKCPHSQKKMLNRCGFSTYTEILAFSNYRLKVGKNTHRNFYAENPAHAI